MSGARTRARPRARGFTLLELLVVLTIAGLVMSLLPMALGGGLTGTDLKAAARKVATGLRQARGHAIVTQQEAVVALDVERREFRVSGDPRVYALPAGVRLELYTAQRDLLDERVGAIRFYPSGASTGGRVSLAHGETRYVVDVDWLTGRVSVQ